MTDRSEWLTVCRFAAYHAISRRTVYNWLQAGKLRYTRTVNGTMRIDPDSGYDTDTGPRTPWVRRDWREA